MTSPELKPPLPNGEDRFGYRLGALLLSFSALSASVTCVRAENSGSADPSLLLRSIPTYTAESEARAACGKDAVVWADRYDGYYYLPDEKQFATTPDGAYACKRAAQGGNYWDTNPLSSMSGQPGRTFPYRPLYVGS